jgi:hypothetical protein
VSWENVEIVRKATGAWNSGGVEATLEFYPDDVVWYPFPDSPGSVTGFAGHDGIREVMAGSRVASSCSRTTARRGWAET